MNINIIKRKGWELCKKIGLLPAITELVSRGMIGARKVDPGDGLPPVVIVDSQSLPGRFLCSAGPRSRHKDRPVILRPFAEEETSSQPVIEWEGQGVRATILIRIAGEEKAVNVVLICTGRNKVSLADLGIHLPDGDGRVYLSIRKPDGKDRHGFGHPMTVRQNGYKDHYAGVLEPGTAQWDKAEQEFLNNLDTLTRDEADAMRNEALEEGAGVILAPPKAVQLTLGHRCNIDCIMCGTGRQQDFNHPPQKLFDELPKLMPFIDNIAITGGEPLLFRQTLPLLKEGAKHPNLRLQLNTNGQALSGDLARAVHDAGCDIMISIDATQKETYEFIRQKASWPRLLENISNAHRPGGKTHLSLNFCIMRRNYNEIVDFVEFADSLGAGQIYYNLMEPGMLLEKHRDQYLLEDEAICREIVESIREAYEKAGQRGLGMTDKVLGWILPKYPHMAITGDENILPPQEAGECVRESESKADMVGKRINCDVPYHKLNIDVENTFVCCHAKTPFSYITRISDGGLFHYWNHPLMQYARVALRQGRGLQEVCLPRCPLFRSNLT